MSYDPFSTTIKYRNTDVGHLGKLWTEIWSLSSDKSYWVANDSIILNYKYDGDLPCREDRTEYYIPVDDKKLLVMASDFTWCEKGKSLYPNGNWELNLPDLGLGMPSKYVIIKIIKDK